MQGWKVVKVKNKHDIIIIEDTMGHRAAYVKIADNVDTDREEIVGAAITLERVKYLFPECTEKLLKYLLELYLHNGIVYDDFMAYVEGMLHRDKNVMYDESKDLYYLKEEVDDV